MMEKSQTAISMLESAKDVFSSVLYNVSCLISEETKKIEGRVLRFFEELTKNFTKKN